MHSDSIPARVATRLFAALLAAAALAGPASAADPGSISRIDAPPCPVLVAPAGTPASVDWPRNGNADIRSWGQAGNASSRLRSRAGAEVAFEAVQRSAQSEATSVDSLVWLGGEAPARVVFEGVLRGGFVIDITRGDIGPPGVEQGLATARIELRATVNGMPAASLAEASLARRSTDAASERWAESVWQPLSLGLAWAPPAPCASLALEQRLLTSATANHNWFRQGAGTVNVRADFWDGSGLRAVRFFGADGQELGDTVDWAWQHGVSPVPEPQAVMLWLAGLLAMARCALLRSRARDLGALPIDPAAALAARSH